MYFHAFSLHCQRLETTASRNTMTELLAKLFHEASSDEIGKICYLLQGRVVPLYEAIEFGIADKLMIRAIAQAYDIDDAVVLREFKKLGDLGGAAEALKGQGTGDKGQASITVIGVYKKLYELTQMSGEGSQDQKITALAELLVDLDPLSARYLVRIPVGKLRLGFSDMTILDALSWMLGGDKSLRSRLEDAYSVRPDIGYLAQSVKAKGIGSISHMKAKVGAPILASLCQRLPTADEMIKKMGRVAVEPKFDGERVQIHAEIQNAKCKIHTFSRNLENTTAMFPELLTIGDQLKAQSVILDSEAVGYDPHTGKLIPFQQTMTRKRKHGIAAAQASVPLRFFVFDILYKDGIDLLSTPLSQRRKILETTIGKGDILVLSPQIAADTADQIREYHDEQLKKGLEGAVVKKWESPYEPGRKGYAWVKFKEEEGKTGKLTDTIDAVIMGYYKGEGKRTDFGIGAFLVGVRRGDEFVTLTKIGTGVSDELWKSLKTRLSDLKVSSQPKEYADVEKIFLPDVWVSPKLVVELAGDDLTKSQEHGAGIAVRFPRLVGIRDDKGPQEATTVREIEQMYTNQSMPQRR